MIATEVTLYTRKDCHLCDDAKASIRAATSLHRLPVNLREVDVDTDAGLRARYSNDVPVILVNGVEAFRHRVTPEAFTAYVRGGVRASSLAALGHVFPPESYPLPDEAIRERWRSQLRRAEATTLLAEVDGREVGLVSFSRAWLESLFVVPELWGTGVAARLHDEAVPKLERPCHLWVLEENHRARRFYDRRGWRADGEQRPANFPPWPPELRYSLPGSED